MTLQLFDDTLSQGIALPAVSLEHFGEFLLSLYQCCIQKVLLGGQTESFQNVGRGEGIYDVLQKSRGARVHLGGGGGRRPPPAPPLKCSPALPG